MTRTNLYVDGFNLYYRAVKGTPYKWLDIEKLFKVVFPHHALNRIRYFTARVKGLPHDPQAPARQFTYLRALQTTPSLSIHFGHFLTNVTSMRLAAPSRRFARVIRVDEKGSDVNLASHLIFDGFDGDYDQAVVLSNDSDLATPIAMVRAKLGLPIGILCPAARTSWELKGTASFVRNIKTHHLASAQFPPQLLDSTGIITKPATW